MHARGTLARSTLAAAYVALKRNASRLAGLPDWHGATGKAMWA